MLTGLTKKQRRAHLISILSMFSYSTYKLGGFDIKTGIDCFFLIKLFCEKAFGIEYIEEFEDVSIYNYIDVFNSDRDKIDLLLTNYMKNVDGLIELSPKKIRTFDIVLFSYKERYIKYDKNLDGLSLGINVGNNNILTSEVAYGVCYKPRKLFKINNLFRARVLS